MLRTLKLKLAWLLPIWMYWRHHAVVMFGNLPLVIMAEDQAVERVK